MMETIDIEGQQLTRSEEKLEEAAKKYWRKVANEGPVQSLGKLEEAGRQLIVLTSGLQGLYFAVFTLSGVWGNLSGWQSWLALLPVALWLLSLFLATLVFVPRERAGADWNELSETAWLDLRKTYLAAIALKRRWLHLSLWVLVLSLAAVLVVFGALTIQPTEPTVSAIQVMIVTPTPPPSPTP